ncbi:BTAD domain-containing putative transcriptional regulator [Streptomyces sp. NPDC004250]|uniref:BTAD domain-containing putative transcriptional regulator n=1 Tax=Streptomyces sp. NPDC004250 TaxID=3364692 RepID=UPI0036BC3B39
MWYGMLGPLVVRHGRDSLDLGPRQRRLLLTRLLIEDGRPVSLSELCHSLWGDEQPTAAVSSIRAHISRLRSVLDPARKSRSSILVSSPPGYALTVPRNARDTAMFEAHVVRARDALTRELLSLARAEIDKALGLWRGPALGEAAEAPFALREATRLNAARQDARELLAAILIGQGDLLPAVSVAEQLTVGAPLREVSWSLLMRALYAAGRPVEALRQYDRFRAMLARELGLDPSPGLRDLHIAILRHDTSSLGIPRSSTALSVDLPGIRAPLVGRTEETARLNALLREAKLGRAQWAVVSGEPGSGKTRLLEEFAALAAEAGFAVTRASGGHALGRDGTAALRCTVTQLADRLRRPSEETDADSTDGPEDILTTLVRQIARVPTLCIVDDLDWAASSVCDQLRRLARLVRDLPVVLVCALRDTQSSAVSGLLADLARLGTTWLRLGVLSTEDVADILAARGESVPPAENAELHRRSEGNPFILGELLKLPPRHRTGPCALVPDAVRKVVQARLAEVSTPARTMLAHAATDGGHLDIGLLTNVQGLTHEQLLRLVDDSVTNRLVDWHPDPRSRTGGQYRLLGTVHDVLLDTLTPSCRQLLHARIARALAAHRDTSPDRLTGHLRAAGPMAPAVAVRPPRRSLLDHEH